MIPEQEIGLIACLTESELFNGASYHRAIKPGRVPTLIEQYCKPGRNVDTFCEAIDRFLLPRDDPRWISEIEMWARLG